jgi:hypothetical protein
MEDSLKNMSADELSVSGSFPDKSVQPPCVQLNVINALTRFKVLKNDQYRLPIPTLYRPGHGTHTFGGVVF